MSIDWRQYHCEDFYDELFQAPGLPREAARRVAEYLDDLTEAELAERRLAADLAIKVMGIKIGRAHV